MHRSVRAGLQMIAVATLFATMSAVANAQRLNVSGAWDTYWGSEEICTLALQQRGNAVSGTYATTGAPPGVVNGVLEGGVLTGTWSDEAGSVGSMRLVFSASGRSFSGTWGSGTSATDGGAWSGSR